MAETPLETNAAAQFAVLVTLRWSNLPTSGDAETVVKYTNWTRDIDILGDESEVFQSIPDMQIELGEIHGGTDDKPSTISISRQHSPFDVLRSGLSHPKVNVTIEQVDPSDIANTRRPMFLGTLGKLRANPGGRASLVKCQINGIKAQLNQINLGVPCLTSCVLPFGGDICGYDKEATKKSGIVIAVGSPERVSIELSVGNGDSPNDLYRRGVIKVAGMFFTIRESYNDGTFDLFKIPPAWLVGKPAELFEGCDKQYSTCTARGRTSRFLGLGIRMPNRQPIFEDESR